MSLLDDLANQFIGVNGLFECQFLSVRDFDAFFLAEQTEHLQLFCVFLFGQQIDLQIQLISLFAQLSLPVLAHQDQRCGESGFK